MPQRNVLVLVVAIALSYACYVRGEQNPFARYVSGALEAIESDSLQQVPDEELFQGAMEGMIGMLRDHGDEHSQFIPREDADSYRTELYQQFGGIGVRIRIDGEPPQLTIAGPPEPGTPAARANLLPGDLILAIDDRPTDGLSMADVLRLMRGAPGAPIRLTIRHVGQPESQTVDLVREMITIDSILGDQRRADGTWKFSLDADPRIALIRVTAFADKTVAELEQALDRLQAEGVEAAVIDLRDDSGGLLDAAVKVCDLFLPGGELIVETRGRGQELRERRVASGNGRYQDLPLAVIVNGNTASASEIVAACLQDHERAVVVGERTYGKGTVQEMLPTESGRSLLKLTAASYWRPSGKNIHRMPDATPDQPWGVEPTADFEVPLLDQEYVAYRQYRSERDQLEQGPVAGSSVGASPEPDGGFVDRPLRKAIEYLQGVLDEQSGL